METLLRETCFPPQGALLTGTDPVATFSCGGCSSHSELGKQYFCLNCRSTRCLSCVNSSVGASFCPQCMEIYVAEDARVFENKCKRCVRCIRCESVLSFRVRQDDSRSSSTPPTSRSRSITLAPPVLGAAGTTVPGSPSTDPNVGTTYLYCAHCGWSSLNPQDAAQARIPLTAETSSKLLAGLLKAGREGPLYEAVNQSTQQLSTLVGGDSPGSLLASLSGSGSPFFTSKRVKPRPQSTPAGPREEDKEWTPSFNIDEDDLPISPLGAQPTKTAAPLPLPSRVALLPMMTRHCGTCNRLLVKPGASVISSSRSKDDEISSVTSRSTTSLMSDSSHTNAFDFKRKHTASLFLPFVSLVSSEVHLSTAQLTIRLVNPQPQSAMSLEIVQGDTVITQVVVGGDDLDIAKTTTTTTIPGTAKVTAYSPDSITVAFSAATTAGKQHECQLMFRVKWVGASSLVGDTLGDDPIEVEVVLKSLRSKQFV